MDLKSMIEKKQKELKKLQEAIKTDERRCPKGILRAYRYKDGYQYYIRKDKKDVYGKYVQKKDIHKAQLLAQKEYDHLLYKCIDEEIKKLDEMVELLKKEPWEKAEEMLPLSKLVLINRPVMSDEDFVCEWKNQIYTGLAFREGSREFHTNRGERVRSKTEVIIANLLDEAQIPYLYEKPLDLGKYGEIHPDFTLLDIKDKKEIIWEHFGMMDDTEYRNNAFQKLREYEANGYFVGSNLIITFETIKLPIDTKSIKRVIDAMIRK